MRVPLGMLPESLWERIDALSRRAVSVVEKEAGENDTTSIELFRDALGQFQVPVL